MKFADGQSITELARHRWSGGSDKRLADVMDALIQHTHEFLRKIQPSPIEWASAVQFFEDTGAASELGRREFVLLADVLGLSMLNILIKDQKGMTGTPQTVMGPFYVDGAPEINVSGDVAYNVSGQKVYVSGVVRNSQGFPLAGAVLDIWQADDDGLYDSQIEDADTRLRAIFRCDDHGRYGFWTIVPHGYSIPLDGPVGNLVQRAGVPSFRPAHIHFLLTAEGHKPLVTHLFRKGADHIDADAVFGVRQELVVPFVRQEAGTAPDGTTIAEPFFVVNYDFILTGETAALAEDIG